MSGPPFVRSGRIRPASGGANQLGVARLRDNRREPNMETQEERCARAKQLRLIDDAFRRGDLEALRAAVDDPAAVPNGPMPITIGSCLVAAIYHSPIAFIRSLLELGADPNRPADDGFPPLIAALSCTRTGSGLPSRSD